MKTRWVITRFALTALLLVTALTAAQALRGLWMVTPKTLKTPEREFAITVREKEGLTAFEIVIKPLKDSKTPLAERLDATLSIREGKKLVATMPLAETREKGRVTYRFAVAASALPESEFRLDEVQWMSGYEGVSYEAVLRDFPPGEYAPTK